eukprot:gene11779-13904_t
MNLSTLMELKNAFDAADTDGSGALDEDEFVGAFRSVQALAEGSTEEELQHLFMKIDANSDGTVDWDEFTNHILLEQARQMATEEDSGVEGELYIRSVNPDAKVDLERKKPKWTVDEHLRGVYSFDFCRSYNFVASCGVERHILMWNPFTGRSVGALHGHSASVQEVMLNEEENQLISLSTDKVIKIWDIRSHKCLQTITDQHTYWPENRISAIMVNPRRRCLVTCGTRPEQWHRLSKDNVGTAPICASLYNSAFRQVVAGDVDCTVTVWSIDRGETVFSFSNLHGDGSTAEPKMSAMCFDNTNRRMITGAQDGTVKMWNFNNGQGARKQFTGGAAGKQKGRRIVSKSTMETQEKPRLAFSSQDKQVDPHGHHYDMIERALYLNSIHAYVTAGRDGMLWCWNAHNLHPTRSLRNGGGWVTDIAHMASQPVAVCSVDRTISFYDSGRSSLEPLARINNLENVPMCAHWLRVSDCDMLLWGDDHGHINAYSFDDEWGSEHIAPGQGIEVGNKKLPGMKPHAPFKLHNDWVTK